MSLLDDTLAAISPIDQAASRAAQVRLDSLTKPLGSLGRLEEIVGRYAAIRRDGAARWGSGAIAVFVADHGVADEGVSAYPKAVTVQMLRNIAEGGAAISVLARHFHFDLRVIDLGVESDTSAEPMRNVVYRRIGAGTQNFLRQPAMTIGDAIRALEVGIEVAGDSARAGATLVGIGEMGIANSTSAAALLCATTGLPPERIAGRGTGLDDARFRRKVEVIGQALALHRDALHDPLARLAALGGFEIAAMAGACLGSAAHHMPVVVDGFIATAAAAIAGGLHSALRDHLFFAHRSSEGGHSLALEHLGARPMLDLDMRLGEGTGAAIAMAVIRAALELFHQMATFAGAGVSEKVR
jgi:nicotinate-nucleotide--dimethylbenzimidazole phosphoribosyltransferase